MSESKEKNIPFRLSPEEYIEFATVILKEYKFRFLNFVNQIEHSVLDNLRFAVRSDGYECYTEKLGFFSFTRNIRDNLSDSIINKIVTASKIDFPENNSLNSVNSIHFTSIKRFINWVAISDYYKRWSPVEDFPDIIALMGGAKNLAEYLSNIAVNNMPTLTNYDIVVKFKDSLDLLISNKSKDGKVSRGLFIPIFNFQVKKDKVSEEMEKIRRRGHTVPSRGKPPTQIYTESIKEISKTKKEETTLALIAEASELPLPSPLQASFSEGGELVASVLGFLEESEVPTHSFLSILSIPEPTKTSRGPPPGLGHIYPKPPHINLTSKIEGSALDILTGRIPALIDQPKVLMNIVSLIGKNSTANLPGDGIALEITAAALGVLLKSFKGWNSEDLLSISRSIGELTASKI
jgi:hypothetical protein